MKDYNYIPPKKPQATMKKEKCKFLGCLSKNEKITAALSTVLLVILVVFVYRA